jgi:hypothetical protein
MREILARSERGIDLESVVIIGKFSDGKCRQIFINEGTGKVIVEAIQEVEGVLSVHEEVLELVDITFSGEGSS